MHDLKKRAAFLQGITALVLIVAVPRLSAQGYAPYSVLYYRTGGQQGDLIVNEIEPAITAPYTYFNAFGWKGGYTGLQLAGDGSSQFIFSIWDPPGTEFRPAIGTLYSAPGGRVERFGGEGTGLHYINPQTTWKPNNWYRIVVRCWDSGDTTRFAFWSQDEQSGIWTLHVIVQSPEAHFHFSNLLYSFLEDWRGTGNLKRRVAYRGTSFRSSSGLWSALDHVAFNVDHGITGSGKFAGAFDAGIEGKAIYLQTGGDTHPTVPDHINFVIPPSAIADSGASGISDVPATKIINLSAKVESGKLTANWALDDHTAPQFSYRLQVFSDERMQGSRIAGLQGVLPQVRDATVAIPAEIAGPLYVKLTVIDLFDRQVSVTVRSR